MCRATREIIIAWCGVFSYYKSQIEILAGRVGVLEVNYGKRSDTEIFYRCVKWVDGNDKYVVRFNST